MTPRVNPAVCRVRVYRDPVPGGAIRDRYDGRVRATPRHCGEPVDRYGLCKHHADDRDRLGGGS